MMDHREGSGAGAASLGARLRRLAGHGAALGAILGVAALGGLALRAPGAPEPAVGAAEPLPVVATEAVERSGYALTRSFAGRVIARRDSAIGFEIPGVVVEVLVDDGDTVAAGDVLARLDTRALEVERTQLEAERDEVRANRALAVRTLERQEFLRREGHATGQRLDEARFDEQALRARLDRLAAAIERIEVDLTKSVIAAPFAGTVSDRRVDEGTVVAAGTPLLRLLETGRREARVGLPARFAGRLAPGSRHPVTLTGATVEGRVTAILPDLDPGTRTVTAVLSLPTGIAAPSGDLARLLLSERIPEPGFWLPTTALTEGLRGLWTVYALAPEPAGGHAVRRETVEVLHTATDRVFVRGTLEPGDLIVAAGAHRLVPGQQVQVVEQRPAPADPDAALVLDEFAPPARSPAG